MIDIKEKKDCCGCSACMSICPKKAITMKYDEEGFRYPCIDKEKCIGCKLCEKVCPFINSKSCDTDNKLSNESLIEERINTLTNNIDCYACYNNDVNVRSASTSGGFFSVLAKHVINNGGYVCGVSYDSDNNICHKIISNEKEISQFRGSKYVQSYQNEVYHKIKALLDDKKMVLYSGTPCQVEGLIKYLQKPYDNLITVDLVCHGVGSQSYWNKYKDYMEWKYKSKIDTISFREKTYGYNSSCMAVYFKNGKVSKKGHSDDKYLLAFFKDYILRPSCYSCKVKTLDRQADYTMGDFWDSSNLPEQFKKANGCTLVLCNNEKSKIIFNEIKEKLTYENISLKEGLLVNSGRNYSMMIKSVNLPNDREVFFSEFKKTNYKDISKLLNKYMPLSFKEKVFCLIKPILYKFKVLELVKKVVK